MDDGVADAEVHHHVAGVLDEVAGDGGGVIAGCRGVDLGAALAGQRRPARPQANAVRPEQSKPTPGSDVFER